MTPSLSLRVDALGPPCAVCGKRITESSAVFAVPIPRDNITNRVKETTWVNRPCGHEVTECPAVTASGQPISYRREVRYACDYCSRDFTDTETWCAQCDPEDSWKPTK